MARCVPSCKPFLLLVQEADKVHNTRSLLQRCVAQEGESLRSRMSLMAQALTNSEILLDSTNFTPHEDHFWPSKNIIGPVLPRTAHDMKTGKISSGLSKQGNCLLLVEPKEVPLLSGIEMESFEYITRNLFVMRGSSIETALSHLAAGAVNLLNIVNSGHPAMATIGDVKIDPKTKVSCLTTTQLVALAKLFERWPFRPSVLFEVSLFKKSKGVVPKR